MNAASEFLERAKIRLGLLWKELTVPESDQRAFLHKLSASDNPTALIAQEIQVLLEKRTEQLALLEEIGHREGLLRRLNDLVHFFSKFRFLDEATFHETRKILDEIQKSTNKIAEMRRGEPVFFKGEDYGKKSTTDLIFYLSSDLYKAMSIGPTAPRSSASASHADSIPSSPPYHRSPAQHHQAPPPPPPPQPQPQPHVHSQPTFFQQPQLYSPYPLYPSQYFAASPFIPNPGYYPMPSPPYQTPHQMGMPYSPMMHSMPPPSFMHESPEHSRQSSGSRKPKNKKHRRAEPEEESEESASEEEISTPVRSPNLNSSTGSGSAGRHSKTKSPSLPQPLAAETSSSPGEVSQKLHIEIDLRNPASPQPIARIISVPSPNSQPLPTVTASIVTTPPPPATPPAPMLKQSAVSVSVSPSIEPVACKGAAIEQTPIVQQAHESPSTQEQQPKAVNFEGPTTPEQTKPHTTVRKGSVHISRRDLEAAGINDDVDAESDSESEEEPQSAPASEEQQTVNFTLPSVEEQSTPVQPKKPKRKGSAYVSSKDLAVAGILVDEEEEEKESEQKTKLPPNVAAREVEIHKNAPHPPRKVGFEPEQESPVGPPKPRRKPSAFISRQHLEDAGIEVEDESSSEGEQEEQSGAETLPAQHSKPSDGQENQTAPAEVSTNAQIPGVVVLPPGVVYYDESDDSEGDESEGELISEEEQETESPQCVESPGAQSAQLMKEMEQLESAKERKEGLLLAERERSASHIQMIVRSEGTEAQGAHRASFVQSQQETKKLEFEIDEIAKKQEEAARKIQAMARGRQARKNVAAMKSQQQPSTPPRQATTQPAVEMSTPTSNASVGDEVEQLLLQMQQMEFARIQERQVQAVIKIQAAVRGRLARKNPPPQAEPSTPIPPAPRRVRIDQEIEMELPHSNPPISTPSAFPLRLRTLSMVSERERVTQSCLQWGSRLAQERAHLEAQLDEEQSPANKARIEQQLRAIIEEEEMVEKVTKRELDFEMRQAGQPQQDESPEPSVSLKTPSRSEQVSGVKTGVSNNADVAAVLAAQQKALKTGKFAKAKQLLVFKIQGSESAEPVLDVEIPEEMLRVHTMEEEEQRFDEIRHTELQRILDAHLRSVLVLQKFYKRFQERKASRMAAASL